MEFYIALHKSEYGYSVSCPTLKGCHSQGDTEEEAIETMSEDDKKSLIHIIDAIEAKNNMRNLVQNFN